MKKSSYNETNTIQVTYRCPRCFKSATTDYKYLSSILTEKKARVLAKQQNCEKCKGGK